MTVLVDQARWEWHGQIWAHLVSDSSIEELHEAARRIGKRRLGFQGDHYDVTKQDRDRAIALGAEPVDSRVLVRRLRDAGLRDRSSKPQWEQLIIWPAGRDIDSVAAVLAPHGSAGSRLADALDQYRSIFTGAAVGLFADSTHLVALLDLEPSMVSPDVTPAVDLHVVGEPRIDGRSSIELFVRI